jgi:hypothetical protein
VLEETEVEPLVEPLAVEVELLEHLLLLLLQ